MKEIFSPFTSKQKLLQMGICALVFIGMAVPFKVMVLIEGLTEVRPVNAVPVVAGLLFGPAGAWGCAVGNLAADLSGTFSQASVLGFAGNFIAAWLPYKLWHFAGGRETPNVKSRKNMVKYIAVCAAAALATAILIACGLDVLFGMWLPQIFRIILFNNLGFSLLLGLPVFIVLTSGESKITATLPENTQVRQRQRSARLRYGLLILLLAGEAALLVMTGLGMRMSASPLMGMTGAIWAIALLGFVVE